MTIRLVCGDGSGLRVSKDYFTNSIFNNEDIAGVPSYNLKCKASPQVLSALLDWLEGLSEEVTVTKDNIEELQSLCDELGFKGLEKEFRAFRGEIGSDLVDLKEFLRLKAHVTRQDKRLTEIQRDLSEVLSWKRKTEAEMRESVSRQFQSLEGKLEDLARICEERNVEFLNWKRKAEAEMRESVSRQFQSLERKVEDLTRVCEERNVESSWKTEQLLRDSAKRGDIGEPARDLAKLKQSENVANVRPAKSLEVIEPKRSALPPLKPPTPAKPAQPKAIEKKTFTYKKDMLDGIIAYLTRECGGNVYAKGIVYVMGPGDGHRGVVNFERRDEHFAARSRGSWLCYDFNDRRVTPTSYSVVACGNDPDCQNLRSWIIEGSNDGYSWTEIDRRKNNNDLSSPYARVNFKISRVPRGSFRFLRLRHNEESDIGTGVYALAIASLELFGTLFLTAKVEQPRPPKQDFVYHEDREGQSPPPLFPPKFDGIIAHLTRECGGNVHSKEIVKVTVSSCSFGHQKNVVDLGAESPYESYEDWNQWICYDFKDRRVIPTGYSLMKSGYDSRQGSWVIEVSNDGTSGSWTEIDRQDDRHDLYEGENFKISRVPSEGFRFFRLRKDGCIHLDSMEIFGTLFEK